LSGIKPRKLSPAVAERRAASMSFIGRINYSFKKSLPAKCDLSKGRDIKNFSPSHQWGNFGSVGAGWVMSDEAFMENIRWIDFLKLKASLG
jgi:hypothetical protein